MQQYEAAVVGAGPIGIEVGAAPQEGRESPSSSSRRGASGGGDLPAGLGTPSSSAARSGSPSPVYPSRPPARRLSPARPTWPTSARWSRPWSCPSVPTKGLTDIKKGGGGVSPQRLKTLTGSKKYQVQKGHPRPGGHGVSPQAGDTWGGFPHGEPLLPGPPPCTSAKG
jgi:hypothetical protein